MPWPPEVLSPSTGGTDRVEKVQVYAREGVSHAWLVDPLAALLEIFGLTDGKWTRLDAFRGDARVRARPFEAIELDLAILWARRSRALHPIPQPPNRALRRSAGPT